MTLGGREGSRTGWNGTHRMDLYEIGSHDRTCLYDRDRKAMAVRGNVRPVRGRCRFAVVIIFEPGTAPGRDPSGLIDMSEMKIEIGESG